MASKLISITAVVGTSPTYTLTVDSVSGVVVEDHVSDNDGQIYRVSVVVGATVLTVVDDVAPDAPEGTPSTGIGSVYTPTPVMKLSQAPYNTPGWDELVRRDIRAIDAAVPTKVDTHDDLTLSSISVGVSSDIYISAGPRYEIAPDGVGAIYIEAGHTSSGNAPEINIRGSPNANGVGGHISLGPGAGTTGGGQVVASKGLTIATEVDRPAASVQRRGQLWVVQGANNVADVMYICVKKNDDTYAWTTVSAPATFAGPGILGDGVFDVADTQIGTNGPHVYYNDLTISASTICNNIILYVKGTLTIEAGGILHCDGGNGGNGVAALRGLGGVGQPNPMGYLGGRFGNVGGTSGGSPAQGSLQATGMGGRAGFSGSGGTGADANENGGFPSISMYDPTFWFGPTPPPFKFTDVWNENGTQTGGSGGPGGGEGATHGASAGGGGGGGGAGGGLVVIIANRVVNNGIIRSVGGNGGNGGIATGGNSGGGGGGGAGGGGVVWIMTADYTGTGTISAAGGTGGTGGSGTGLGGNGGNGTSGLSGTAVIINPLTGDAQVLSITTGT